MTLTRRTWLATTLGFPAVLRGAPEPTRPLDEAVQRVMQKYGIPGAALGIARGGKVAYVKGFGLASRERGEAVQADSRFRLASVSKPLTAAAVLRLCEQGKLSLDEAVLPKLGLEPLTGGFGDPRWGAVTVRHLLQHTGGWDKAVSGDAMFRSPEICRAAGIRGPADAQLTVRWMLGRRLDFSPGSRYSYCNFGYCVLGRVIEAVTGQSYAKAMQRLVFAPCGAQDIELGRSLTRLSKEVSYYHNEATLGPGVFPSLPAQVAWPYGTFSLEANDANGGFIASVTDVLRFLTSLDERAARPLLSKEWLHIMCQSAAPGSATASAYHALGWYVRPRGQAGRPDLWYIGGLPGTKSIVTRLGDGFDWVILFNSRPGEFDSFNVEVRNAIHTAARQVPGWG